MYTIWIAMTVLVIVDAYKKLYTLRNMPAASSGNWYRYTSIKNVNNGETPILIEKSVKKNSADDKEKIGSMVRRQACRRNQ
ncbi:hypothetical protein CEXT_23801 [Caerostris extrusa]|uniref:Uncharacterized protein n=1 Tax=Caerostris extrusa TaxID=172846 RepID=A0AAV4MUL9_CAEEX|nr:hypothetical protein CEXT_23801 [Caerostris extrusa]